MEQYAHTSRLEAAVKRPENQFCADCQVNASRWASINLGLFLCIECAGIHRGLGTHISKVRSIALDKWSPENVKAVTQVGNRIANEYFEATLPGNFRRPQPSQNSSAMASFIHEKYAERRWIPPGNPLTPVERLVQGETLSPSATSAPGAGGNHTVAGLGAPPHGRRRAQAKTATTDSLSQTLPLQPLLDQESKAALKKTVNPSNSPPSLQLQDFWASSPTHEVITPSTARAPIPCADPTAGAEMNTVPNCVAALGYAMDPPTLRKVHDAKTIAARESLDQLFVGSGSGFGVPTYASVAAKFVWPTCDTSIGSWKSAKPGTASRTVSALPKQPEEEDTSSFKSAIDRNLAALNDLSNG